MDIDAFVRREKMLQLREELLSVEEDRLSGLTGMDLEELGRRLDQIIDEEANESTKSV
jgi:RecJ-like exonuclease